MNFQIVPLSADKYDIWNKFCYESDTAWFRHTTWFIDYILNSRFDSKSLNLSFMVYLNSKLIALVPLIKQTIYNSNNLFEFAMLDTNTPFPCFSNDINPENKKDITKIIFQKIDELAFQENVCYSRFFFDDLTEDILKSHQKTNPLPKLGFTDTTISTNILIFKNNEENELLKMRKGHKADIKFAAKEGFVVDIFSNDNITEDIFNIFKQIHFIDAGRKTRPDESWSSMLNWIKNGHCILALEKNKSSSEYISGALVIIYKNKAYYGSSGTLPTHEGKRGIGHILQWEVICHLKRQCINYYDIGWNFTKGFSQEIASQKEMNISMFKSGFGGEQYPIFRAEKFYNKEYFLQTYNNRIDKIVF